MTAVEPYLEKAGKRVLLLGNEAIARGLLEAGVDACTAYPGTPSTEILETLIAAAPRLGHYVEWSTNEKTATETAISAAMCGLRASVSMKGVGVNVASEPMQAFTYMGTVGGFVLITADDPSMNSSHNEQDNRYFAREAYLPVFEPADSTEAKEVARRALLLSEEWRQPVILRSTTAIGHSSSPVVLGGLPKRERKGAFPRDPKRWTNLPQNARRMRNELLERIAAIRENVERVEFNSESGTGEVGFIASGAAYPLLAESLERIGLAGRCRVLKMGTPFPIPEKMVAGFLEKCGKVLVVEELEPFVEEQVEALAQRLGLSVRIEGKSRIPIAGELTVGRVLPGINAFLGGTEGAGGRGPGAGSREPGTVAVVPAPEDRSTLPKSSPALFAPPNCPSENPRGKSGDLRSPSPMTTAPAAVHGPGTRHPAPVPLSAIDAQAAELALPRPPVLCAGCLHRNAFFALNLAEKKLGGRRLIRPSDIGCYTLGYQPPLNAVDTNFCMGAGIGISSGLARFSGDKVAAQIGDSTFFHAGIPPLINAVVNGADVVLLLLDNKTTAMTGHQPHPGVGRSASGDAAPGLDIEDMVRACGVKNIDVVPGWEIGAISAALDRAVRRKGVSVIIVRQRCALMVMRQRRAAGVKVPACRVDEKRCRGCFVCINRFGCPAMRPAEKRMRIDGEACSGCGACLDPAVCPEGAIKGRKGGMR